MDERRKCRLGPGSGSVRVRSLESGVQRESQECSPIVLVVRSRVVARCLSSFDRALRAAARRGRPVDVCPDAAMLAAYVDNALTPDERLTVEAHAADCATCLQHLALLGAVSVEPPSGPSRPFVAGAVGLARAGGHRRAGRGRVDSAARSARDAAVGGLVPPGVEQRRPGADVVLSAPAEERREGCARAAGGCETEGAPRLRRKDAAARLPPNAKPRTSRRLAWTSSARKQKTDAAPPLETRQRRVQPQAAAPAAPPAPGDGDARAGRGRHGQQADRAQAETAATRSRCGRGRRRVAARRRGAEEGSRRPAGRVGVASERVSRAGTSNRAVRGDGATWREVSARPVATFTAAACGPDGPCWFGTADGQLLRRTGRRSSRSRCRYARAVVAIAPEAARPPSSPSTTASASARPTAAPPGSHSVARTRHSAPDLEPAILHPATLAPGPRPARFPPSSVLPMKAPHPAPRRSDMRFSIPFWRRATAPFWASGCWACWPPAAHRRR